MDEKELERLLKLDLSVGTEAFRDELLARCLSELHDHGRELDDSELEMLAAAGNIESIERGETWE